MELMCVTCADKVCKALLPCPSQDYLNTKQNRMDHILGDQFEGQFCYWDHSGEQSDSVKLLPTAYSSHVIYRRVA